jgi:hypothetical protein|tara:strand:- start:117 stop:326 length:210 start_codon:yes stop_codon:yes gene_type:complete
MQASRQVTRLPVGSAIALAAADAATDAAADAAPWRRYLSIATGYASPSSPVCRQVSRARYDIEEERSKS